MREGWRTVRLDEVAALQMGETLIAKDLTGEGLPVFSAAKDAEPWGFTSHARKRFRRGTIVIGARGTIGFPRLPDFDEFISTQTTIAVTPGPSADPAFLAHALARIDYSEVSAHQAVPMLTIGSFRDVEVSLPPLDEQRRIAAVLSAVENTTLRHHEVLRHLRGTKSAIRERLLLAEAGGWPAVPLSEAEDRGLVELRRGQVISKMDMAADPGSYPVYSSSARNEGLFGRYAKFLFDEELISWSIDGGGAFFYRARHRFSVTNVSGFLRVRSNDLDAKFLHYALDAQHSRLHFDYTFKAHPSVIRNLYTVPMPPLAEQRRIAAVLSAVDASHARTLDEITATAHLKRAVTQHLFAGFSE